MTTVDSSKPNLFITAALPYVNNEPHLGNIIGCVLSADVYARFSRLVGRRTLFVCGTDEYGTATEMKAIQEGLSCQEICDKYHAIHKRIYDWFQISFDRFGRTSTEAQTRITHQIFTELYNNGYIEVRPVEQLYCAKLGKFVADRYVTGYCYHPPCKGKKISCRGDQCDGCGGLIDAKLLEQPVCSINGETPVVKSSHQLFIRLDKLEPKVREYLASGRLKMNNTADGITRSWLSKSLQARSISRDLEWGTNVPILSDELKIMEGKVFYVWFDAPIGYLSIASSVDGYEEWMTPDTEWVQFMAKDNVAFHTILFPATLIGCTTKFPKVTLLDGIEYLNYNGRKFSKSRNVGVFGTDVISISERIGFDPAYWRYYLIRIRPETSDASFRWDEFVKVINGELVANLGNLVNRVSSLVWKHRSKQTLEFNPADYPEVYSEARELKDRWQDALSESKLRDGLLLSMEVSHLANRFIQTTKPWMLAKGDDPKALDRCLGTGLWLIELISNLISPFIPTRTELIQSCLIGDPVPYAELVTPHPIGLSKKIPLLFKPVKYDQLVESLDELGVEV